LELIVIQRDDGNTWVEKNCGRVFPQSFGGIVKSAVKGLALLPCHTLMPLALREREGGQAATINVLRIYQGRVLADLRRRSMLELGKEICWRALRAMK